MKEIKVIIDQSGKVKVEVSGISGKDCLSETKELEESLGIKNGERKLKPEYHCLPVKGIRNAR